MRDKPEIKNPTPDFGDNIQFDDIFDLADIQRLQDLFSDSTGVASVITHPDGTPITRSSNFCRLCNDVIRKTEKGRVNCFQSDAMIGRQNPSGPIVQQCLSGGLWDAGASITVGGKHLANWLIGQVRNEEVDEIRILQYADEIGVNREDFRKALNEVTVMSVEKFNNVAKMLFAFANELSEKAYINLQLKMQINESRQAEASLKQALEWQEAIFEGSLNAIFISDQDSRFIAVNNAACDLTGYSRKQLLKMRIPDLHDHPDLEAYNIYHQRIFGGEEILSGAKILRSDGVKTETEFNNKCVSIAGKLYMHTTASDITVRKQAEETLRESDRWFRKLADTISTSIFIFQNERMVFVNRATLIYSGYTEEEALSLPFWKFIHPDYRELVRERGIARQLGEPVLVRYEVKVECKNGEERWVDFTAGNIDWQGQPAILGSAIDITERKRIEQALTEANTQLTRAQRIAHLGNWNDYLPTNQLTWSEEMYHILGFPPDIPMKLEDVTSVFPPEELERFGNAVDAAINADVPYSIDYKIIRPDGAVRYIHDEAEIIRDEQGRAIWMYGTTQDITERRQAEEALRYQNEMRQTILDNIPVMVASFDPEGHYQFINQCWESTLGWSFEETVFNDILAGLYPEPEYREYVMNYIRNATGNWGDFKTTTRDGRVLDTTWIKVPLSDGSSIGIGLDITERKRVEEMIRNLARFPSENPDPVMRVDRNGLLLYANAACYKTLTWKLQIGKRTPSVLQKIIAEVLKEGIGKRVDTEHNSRTISFNIIPVSEGGYTNLYGRDITERKQVEDALLLEKENFRSSLDDSPLGIRIVSPEGNTIYANQAILNFYGYDSLGELQKTPLRKRYTPESFAEAQIRKHQRENGDFSATSYEISIVRKNGEIRHLQVFRKEVLWDGSWHFQVIYEDITDRKWAEEEIKLKNEELTKILSEKDKFFSIIAHDLRSPFNGFLGLTQIMTEELPGMTRDEIQEIALCMRNSATNLFYLLENLLQWARVKQGIIPFDPELLHLLPVVDESITMELESAKNKKIELIFDIPGDLDVFADRNMLQTIIRNLVSNAVKFTHKGGKVTISAKATDDHSVEISVEDSGIGMSPAMVDNLFRSDVQTSRKGTEGESSTGLGLLLCKEFIEKHGGKIRAESNPESKPGEKVSVFYFTIPYNKEDFFLR